LSEKAKHDRIVGHGCHPDPATRTIKIGSSAAAADVLDHIDIGTHGVARVHSVCVLGEIGESYHCLNTLVFKLR